MVAVALQKIDWAKLDRLLTDLVESLTPAFTHDPVLSANLRTMSYEVSVLKTRFEVRRISLQAFANQ
jgi:hypothetical protein